ENSDPLRRAGRGGVDALDGVLWILPIDDDVLAQGEGLAEHRQPVQLAFGDETDGERHETERAPDVEIAQVIADQDVALAGGQVPEAIAFQIDAARPYDPAAPQAPEDVDRATAAADQRGGDGQQAEPDGGDENPRVGRQPPQVAHWVLDGEGPQRIARGT